MWSMLAPEIVQPVRAVDPAEYVLKEPEPDGSSNPPFTTATAPAVLAIVVMANAATIVLILMKYPR